MVRTKENEFKSTLSQKLEKNSLGEDVEDGSNIEFKRLIS